MRRFVHVVVTVLMVLSTGAAAQAGVIFDNFGPGDAYHPVLSYYVQYETDWVTAGNLFNQDIATRFGPVTATEYLTSVDLSLSTAGVTDTAYIYLMSGSPEPTALVDFATYTGLPAFTGTILPPISVPFDSYELVPGETYWIVVSSIDVDDSDLHWGMNSIGMTGGHAAYTAVNLVGSWTVYDGGATPALRVHVESQPVATDSESWGSLKALFR